MAVDDDILSTLKRIETVLKGGSAASGLGRAPVRGAGTQRREEAGKDKDRTSPRTYKATTAAITGLGDSADRLSRTFSGLSKTVLNTRSNFIEMNRSMRAYTRNAPTANVTGGQERVPEGADATAGLTRLLTRTFKAILPGRREPRTPTPGETAASRRGGGNPINDLMGPGGSIPNLRNSLNSLSGRVNFAGIAIAGVLVQLSAAVRPLIDDVLKLHSVGIQASSALGGLYLDAARAGLSLAEYTQVLQESSPAVTRALSMKSFNETLQTSRDRLENLGIFGAEATKLSASLANSATVLGVPQQQMADAAQRQISTFEALRKSSLLTAEQFQQLTTQLASQQEVQSQLLGMSGPQRAARMTELTQLKTFGLSLGASKEASDAFGDALIKQRNLTAPKRFEAAGRIRQAGAALGMDAAAADELARLSRRKNLTGADAQRALTLGTDLQSRIERGLNSGNINQENIAEQLQASLDASGIGTLLKTGANVGLQVQSGQAGVNKDFATGTSDLLKATGRLMSWLDGLEKNPITSAIAGALGSAAFSLGIGHALGRVLTRSRLPGGLPGGPTPPGGAGAGGIISRAKNVVSGTWEVLKRMTSFSSMGPTIAQLGGSIKGGFEVMSRGLGSALGYAHNAFDTAKNFGSTVLSTISRMGSAIQGAFQMLRGGVAPMVEGISGLIGKISTSITNVGSGLMNALTGAAKTLGPALMGGLKSVFMGAFRFIGGTGVINAIFGGVMELFTGDLNSALNAEDGSTWFGDGIGGFISKLMGKVGDIVGGMVRGFATGITGLGDLIIDIWNSTIGNLFGGLKIELGSTLTNFFDRTWTDMMIMFKELKLKAAEFFGMSDTAAAIKKDIAVAKKSRDELEKGGDRTLTTIGDANQKLLEEQKVAAAKTKDNVKTATASVAVAAGVVGSTKDLTSRLLTDTAAIRTQQTSEVLKTQSVAAAQAAQPAIAVPGQTTRNSVTEPTVNKPVEVVVPPAPAPTTVGEAPGPTPTDALLTQFAIMNGLLQQMLTAEQLQAAGLEGLARGLGRPVFADHEKQFALLHQT